MGLLDGLDSLGLSGIENISLYEEEKALAGKKTELLEEYLKLSDTQYKGLFGCKDHGLIFVTLERTVMEDGKKGIFQTAKISDEQSLPYVNTKRLQWRNKLEARKNAPRKKRQTATKPEDSHADTVS